MAKNTYTKLLLNREKINVQLLAEGASEIDTRLTSEKNHEHLVSVQYEEKSFQFKLFFNEDGTTTIGRAAGQSAETFEKIADAIASGCKFGEKRSLELSAKISQKSLDEIFNYLESENVTRGDLEEKQNFVQQKWTGEFGDSIIVKQYQNGTVQFQGKHAHTAMLLTDYLCNVLSLDEIINSQIKTFDVPVKIQDIKDELAARVPLMDIRFGDVIKKQFSSAITLTKINVELEDYACMAFPALRGLEGCIKQLLGEAGFKPIGTIMIGEYFVDTSAGYQMRKPHGDSIGAVYRQVIESLYNHYHKQRHRLFHMDYPDVSTRVIQKPHEAREIVDAVLSLVENECEKLPLRK